LQPISQGFAGLHFDEYALVIDRMPAGVSPEAFLAGILRDPHQAIDDDPDFRYWNDFKRLGKGEPRPGEIYTIDMWGPENGDVVLSDKSPAHFMFTTINTGRRGHGEHPLYGNREFGIESNPDGTVTFYTRGASRSAGIAERVLSPTPQDRTWKAMMNGEGPLGELLAAEEWFLDVRPLRYLSHFITPASSPIRFTARFFLSPLPAGQEPRLFLEETSEGLWVTPREGYTRFRAGEMAMAEPAEYTLGYLAQFESYAAVWANHADGRPKFRGIVDRFDFYGEGYDWAGRTWKFNKPAWHA